MKGDRHHVYMVTFYTTDGGGSTVIQTFSFRSNKNGWDLQKEIEVNNPESLNDYLTKLVLTIEEEKPKEANNPMENEVC